MRPDVGILRLFLICACLSVARAACAQSSAPTLAVDVSSGRHAISRDIYGIANGVDAAFAKEIELGNVRWGGDATTRYNWQVDSSNAGFDWYFMGGNGETSPTPSGSADQMIRTYQPADVLITIPILPWVNKTSAWNCSFPVSVYGAQQSTNPYVHPNNDNCGNSIAANGNQLTDTNVYANHIDNSTGLQKGWLQHLVGTFGTAGGGGVPFYQLDNEPYGWSNTHRDVMPTQADYPTITQLGQQYAAAIKQVDPTAMVLGPSDFTLGGWVGDTSKQNSLFAGQYYLQQMAAYEKQNGVRILDYFDEHYYFDTSSAVAQLASTRTLWDPTYNGGTWVEQWDFDGPMQLIPRFKSWVSQYYPGTKISLSEYSIDSGSKSIVDAIAEMDVLGIFGREQLDFADMWSPPAPTDPIAYAYRMFRNYDGAGAQYGDTWVDATSSSQGQLSIYAAQRSTDHVVTILVINKTTAAISTAIAVAGMNLPASASVYSYTGANLQQIVSGAPEPISNGAINHSFPAYSATLFSIIPAAAQPTTTTTSLTASTQQPTSQSVTLTASVTGSSSPGGVVTFEDTNGATIGTAILSSGVAMLKTSSLVAGSHTITAVYSGDVNNAPSTSNQLTITVPSSQLSSTTTTLTASTTQISYGQSVMVTIAVSAASGVPTGTATITDAGSVLGSVSLTGGTASFTLSNLAIGTHSIVAAYGGDTSNAASASTAVTIVVAQPASPPPPPSPPAPLETTTVLHTSATQLTIGQSVTLTASLLAASGQPTGTVTFTDGGSTLGTAQVSGGSASIAVNTNTLSAGTYEIIASYSGDGADSPSVSAPLTLILVGATTPTPQPDFSLTLAQPSMSILPGNSGQMMLTVTPQNGFSQQLNLSCTGLPAGATCTFSPSVLNPSSSTTSSMTITVPSTNTSAGSVFLLPVPIAFLLWMRRYKRPALFGAASLLILLGGCGSGSVDPNVANTATNGSSPASYVVQVTASSPGSASHSQQLHLSVP
jgi:Glycoside hydrolase family 44/Bacterial Ig-like domain (group 3)